MRRAIGLLALAGLPLAACEEFPVRAPVVGEVVVVAERTTLLVGESARLQARVNGLDGDPILGAPVRWRSLQPEIAGVDEAGTVTARAPGTATILAESGGREARVPIRVEARAASLTIIGNTTVALGDTIRLAAEIAAADGEPIDRGVHWASLDLDVALVAKNGSVRGVMLGIAPIVAQLEGLADTVEVRVVQAEEAPDRGP